VAWGAAGGISAAPAARSGTGAPDAYARQTAADRPGIAQPVPARPVPTQPWNRILAAALVLLAILLGAWEAYWRSTGVTPGIRNSDGLWAQQRRRIDAGEGNATVVIGDSRLLFDFQLPVWEKLSGERAIQLSLEGTSPFFALEDLAADEHFTGRLLVGLAPLNLLRNGGTRAGVLAYTRRESPSQRIGQWLSMHLLEPYLAFDDPDLALQAVLERQAWPPRPGLTPFPAVRKLAVTEADRNSYLWSKIESDPDYRALVRRFWQGRRFGTLPLPVESQPPEKWPALIDEQIAGAARAVAKLRARGVRVVFVRPPSGGLYLEEEERDLPRERTFEPLLAATGAPGIHFQDYPELQGLEPPEWSHLSRADAERFTAALYAILERTRWEPKPAGSGSAARQP
jgi:hypothetical protein